MHFSDDLYLGPVVANMGTQTAATSLASVVVVSGGSGYAVGDTFILNGAGVPAVLTVATINSGAILTATVTSSGAYSNPLIGTTATTTLTGTGSAATFTPTYNAAVNNLPSPMSLGIGPVGRVFVYDVVPAAPQAAGLVASVTPTLNQVLTLTTAAGISTATNAAGQSVKVLDTPRALALVCGAATQTSITVSGYDVYGQAMTETIAGSASSTVNGKKAFKSIVSITAGAAPTNAITVGTSSILGLPVAVRDVAYIMSVRTNATLAQDAGTFVAAVSLTPSATTGDVRGTYLPGTTPNGAIRTVITIALTGWQVGPNATRVGALGNTQA